MENLKWYQISRKKENRKKQGRDFNTHIDQFYNRNLSAFII